MKIKEIGNEQLTSTRNLGSGLVIFYIRERDTQSIMSRPCQLLGVDSRHLERELLTVGGV